jgi:hypothetical protein
MTGSMATTLESREFVVPFWTWARWLREQTRSGNPTIRPCGAGASGGDAFSIRSCHNRPGKRHRA